MIKDEYNYGRCGVFCEMCPTGNGQIKSHAEELLRLTENAYSWAENIVNFKFQDVREGLKWMSNQTCPGCKNISEPWCEALKCEKIQKLKTCLLCEEIETCSRISYQRDRYPFILDHHKRIKKIGIEEFYKEEREKSRRGVTLIDIRKW